MRMVGSHSHGFLIFFHLHNTSMYVHTTQKQLNVTKIVPCIECERHVYYPFIFLFIFNCKTKFLDRKVKLE